MTFIILLLRLKVRLIISLENFLLWPERFCANTVLVTSLHTFGFLNHWQLCLLICGQQFMGILYNLSQYIHWKHQAVKTGRVKDYQLWVHDSWRIQKDFFLWYLLDHDYGQQDYRVESGSIQSCTQVYMYTSTCTHSVFITMDTLYYT